MRTKSFIGPQACWLLGRNHARWQFAQIADVSYEEALGAAFLPQFTSGGSLGRGPSLTMGIWDEIAPWVKPRDPALAVFIYGHEDPSEDEIARAEALYGEK